MTNIYYAIIPFLSGTITIIFGFIIFRANPGLERNRAMSRMCIGVAIWLYCYTINYLFPNSEKLNLFLSKLSYLGVTMVWLGYLHFTVEFLQIKARRLLSWAYAIGFITVLLALFTDLIVVNNYHYYFGSYPKAGKLHPICLLYAACVWLYCLFQLYEAYNNKEKKYAATDITRIKYVFWAYFIGNIASIDYIQNYGVEFYPIGAVNVTIMIGVMTYAIVKHQLLEIEVVIKKTLVFAGLLASVLAMLILPTLLIQEYITRGASFGDKIIGLAISGIIIIFTMRRIEAFLINITDKHLFQKKYDYKELLKTFTTEVLTVLDLDKLVHLTADKIADIMKIDFCRVLLPDKVKSDGRQKVFNHNGELIIPMTMYGENIGTLLLGKKKSDEDYTQDDIDILLPLSRTLAIAISNAHLLKELGEAQNDVVHKEKLSSIGILAAGMAHEIRNPISTIKVFTQYLPERLPQPEFVDKYNKIVIREVDKIDHIIQSLIDFSDNGNAMKSENVSIADVLDEVVSLVSIEHENTTKFIRNIPPNLPHIKINKKEFGEILLNLVENALHAVKKDGNVIFNATEKNNAVELEIKDTGSGMSQDILQHIFEPFFTTKAKGIGLGLFVVNELVKRNDGKISVKSDAGKGTSIILTLRKMQGRV